MDRDQLEQAMHISPAEVAKQLDRGMLDYLKSMNRDRLVFGLSGGVDSAVVAKLCARIVPNDKIMALIMPDKEGRAGNTRDAVDLARELGIPYKVIPLDRYLEQANVRFPVPFVGYSVKSWLVRRFYRKMKKRTGETPLQTILKGGGDYRFSRYLNKGIANYRFKHRLRLTFLYQAAEETNAMVVGAANRTEYLTGFFVKFGIDHHADIMPLLNLYKVQVYELASWLELPGKFIDKPPSPDMIPGITDEFALELHYEELDMLLYALENGITPEGSLAAHKDYVQSLMDHSTRMRRVHVPDAGVSHPLGDL
ncbi:MAG: NAD(+) synthase [Bacteroidales bacterium]|nr:NAD(+) synthase [Bacteroidales bacterium]